MPNSRRVRQINLTTDTDMATTITCDKCGKPLNGKSHIKLAELSVLPEDSTLKLMYAVCNPPLIKQPVEFCSIECLKLWIGSELPSVKEAGSLGQ